MISSIKFFNNKVMGPVPKKLNIWDRYSQNTIRCPYPYPRPEELWHLAHVPLLCKRAVGKIQYRAGKIVTGALHYTSKEKLNLELGWETIIDRGNLLSLSIFHKIHLH